jgi:replicative DNA helicase
LTAEVSTEVTLLQILKHRREYESLGRAVPKTALVERAQMLFDDFGAFFQEFPDINVIPLDGFLLWFKAFKHRTRTADQLALDTALIEAALKRDADESLRTGILERLLAAESAMRVTDVLTKFKDGEEIDLYVALRAEVRRYEENTARKVLIPEVDPDMAAQLAEDMDNSGLLWRLPELNRCMRPLRGGDFLIWAGRPGKGKTSGLICEATHMVRQFDEYYGTDEARPLVWFNNEGPGKRIWRRMYHAALNATSADLYRLQDTGLLEDKFRDATHGGRDRIKVLDVHRYWNHQIETICEKIRPGLIVFDMIDNVKFKGSNSSGDRTDLALEGMYQWGRELGVLCDCPVIATSQSSVDASDVPFPKDHMLKDSKTGKQGACDGIIFMGSDAEHPDLRYISVAKSKLNRPGEPQSPNCQVTLDGERCRLVPPGA